MLEDFIVMFIAVDISVAFSIKTEHRKKWVHLKGEKKNVFHSLKENFAVAVVGDLMHV